MKYRKLGKTNFQVSEISLGTWQVGGKWGSGFDDANADKILHTAIDAGVNFIDTADVYEMGLSEQAVGRVVNSRSEKIYIATKCGRQINPHISENYTTKVLKKYVEDSLQRMKVESLDLIQLHCPPMEVYYRPEIFGLFEDLKKEGKIQHLGVSVEKVEMAMKAMEFDNVTTVQIIFNMFRQRPAADFFAKALKKDVGIIVRVPLASGLLTGKFSMDSQFEEADHRFFNREGAAFDKGETFSGIPYEKGLAAMTALKQLFPNAKNLAPIALRWILDHEAVSCTIPGASKVAHLLSNIEATELPALSEKEKQEILAIYEAHIKPLVHQLW